jgi:hypothetical protein
MLTILAVELNFWSTIFKEGFEEEWNSILPTTYILLYEVLLNIVPKGTVLMQ